MFIWEAAKTAERLREKVKFREKGEETVEDGSLTFQYLLKETE